MRDLVFTALLVGLLPVCLLRPWIGVLVWFWIAFMSPHRLTWGFAFNLPVAMIVGGATLIGLLFTRDRKPISSEPEIVLIAIISVHFTVTTLFAMVPESAWPKWDQVMKILLMTLVTTMLIYGRARITALLYVITLSIGFYGLKGGLWSLLRGGMERVRGPTRSFIEDNNALALALVMVIPLLLALAHEQERRWVRWGLYSIAGVSVIATIFTYSRGGLLGLAVIIFLLLLQSKRRVLAMLTVVAAGVFLLWFAPDKLYKRAETIGTYQEDSSAMLRFQAWSVSLNLALERPLTGGGFKIENLPDEVWLSYADRQFDKWGSIARSPHSIYFGPLGEHGFVGLFLFVALLGTTLWSLRKLKNDWKAAGPPYRWVETYSTGLQVSIAGYAVSGLFQPQPYFDLYYAYVALTVLLKRELKIATPNAQHRAMGVANAHGVPNGQFRQPAPPR